MAWRSAVRIELDEAERCELEARTRRRKISRADAMRCPACGAEWPIRDGVPFYSSADYFGEVSQAEMRTLIQLASQTNWRTAIRAQFKENNPELYVYATDLNRASWIPLLPIGPSSTVLNVPPRILSTIVALMNPAAA